jgi:hypothetical protein
MFRENFKSERLSLNLPDDRLFLFFFHRFPFDANYRVNHTDHNILEFLLKREENKSMDLGFDNFYFVS